MSDKKNDTTNPQPQQAQPRKIAKAKDFKRSKTGEVELSPGKWVVIRTDLDLPTLLFTGAIPAQIATVAEEFQRARNSIANDNFQAAQDQMQGEKFLQIKDMLRNIAARILVEPRATISKKEAAANDELLWLGGFTDIPEEAAQLKAANIPPEDEQGDLAFVELSALFSLALRENRVRVLPREDAATFRQEHSASAGAVRAGEDVRETAV